MGARKVAIDLVQKKDNICFNKIIILDLDSMTSSIHEAHKFKQLLGEKGASNIRKRFL